eukprot:TRINITY_DN33326_c0_g1_i1.p1 TRINITY_DN33326_c0_g1~~TRINITY_DN33326_c0_g1_i1.p1  ORF type:complete len:288 (+),score=78.34 TRINITY_DN33326_c0_g1_i1:201-1064(+)
MGGRYDTRPWNWFRLGSAVAIIISAIMQIVAVAVQEWVSVRVTTDDITHQTRGASTVRVTAGLYSATVNDCCTAHWVQKTAQEGGDSCPTEADNCRDITADSTSVLCPRSSAAPTCGSIQRDIHAVRGLAASATIISGLFMVLLYLHYAQAACVACMLVAILCVAAVLTWEMRVKDELLSKFVARYGPSSQGSFSVEHEPAFFVYIVALMLAFFALILNLASLWIDNGEDQAAQQAQAREAELGIVDDGVANPQRAEHQAPSVHSEDNPVLLYFPAASRSNPEMSKS